MIRARNIENRDIGEVSLEQMVNEVGLTAAHVNERGVRTDAEFVKEIERNHRFAFVPAMSSLVRTEVHGVPMDFSLLRSGETFGHTRDGTDVLVRARIGRSSAAALCSLPMKERALFIVPRSVQRTERPATMLSENRPIGSRRYL